MPARRKQRVLQHIMEDGSYHIIKGLIPQEWVIREFNRPDYGIDLVIELFEVVDEIECIAETLGEYIFVQVKSVKSLAPKTKRIYSVMNVTKGYWKEDRTEYMDLDVVKYSLDTDTIFTIQQSGASVSVLIFLVDLSSSEVYFICLNDYIDKILLPKKPDYAKQDSYTIDIPYANKLSDKSLAETALLFYGKRAKLLAAFSRFYYQKNEILHLFDIMDFPVLTLRHDIEAELQPRDDEIVSQLNYFIEQLEYLDIWTIKFWAPINDAYLDLQAIKKRLSNPKTDINELKASVLLAWNRLSNLGNMYEEICREWYLPKVLGVLCSYDPCPELVKISK